MSTRISDLPDSGIAYNSDTIRSDTIRSDTIRSDTIRSDPPRIGTDPNIQNTYIPMNVHPNPYGNPVAPTNIDHPINVRGNGNSEVLTQDQQMMLERTPFQQLPSRDIRMDTADYMQDPLSIPNYIPPPKTTNDYVKDHENVVKETFEKHRREKYRESRLDMIITELQVPIMIGMLYFIFQLPYVNSILTKYLPFLVLYGDDGNPNFNGLILKSILFGGLYYITTQVIEYLTV